MKKSELTQLTQIIEHLVAREVRKQLPTIIAETFQNMMGKKVITEARQPVSTPEPELIEEEVQPDDETNMKTSLRELFAGTSVMGPSPQATQARQPRQFCKDPKLNAILNETTPDLRQREGMVGMAAFQGGYSPSVAMAAAAMGGVGMVMEETPDPAFMRGVPTMPGATTVPRASIPMGRPPVLVEGQVSNHIPLEALPQGVSVLDVARQVPLAAPVTQALTKNYSQMMKLIDSKKKGRM